MEDLRTEPVATARPRDLSPEERRELFRLGRVQALTSLLTARSDLRGVSRVADHLDDAVRWSA